MEMNLIDAHVHTSGHREAGRVLRVAMEPESRHITHLVVHQGLLLGRNVVVPIEKVAHMAPDHVDLAMTAEELKALPDFVETEWANPADGWDYPVAFPMGGIVWPLSTGWMTANPYPFLGAVHQKDNIPEDEVTLAAGTTVECTDGTCGRVDRVLLDDETHEMVGFVIRRGFLFTNDVKAPVSWIDHLDKHTVHLKLTRKQVSEMAEYFE